VIRVNDIRKLRDLLRRDVDRRQKHIMELQETIIVEKEEIINSMTLITDYNKMILEEKIEKTNKKVKENAN